MEIELIFGNEIEEIRKLDIKVNCIIADVPQGITRNKWDIPFDLKELWTAIENITEDNTPVILMSNQPYTTQLIMSNIKNYKYSWYWQKKRGRGHLNAKKQPLRDIEEICVFYRKQCFYIPQLTRGKKNHSRGKTLNSYTGTGTTYGKYKKVQTEGDMKYPKQLLSFEEPHPPIYATQKPIKLIEYLLNTYTKEGDTVLDFCMGSGTTGIACKNMNRKFIGIDNSVEAYKIAKIRLEKE